MRAVSKYVIPGCIVVVTVAIIATLMILESSPERKIEGKVAEISLMSSDRQEIESLANSFFVDATNFGYVSEVVEKNPEKFINKDPDAVITRKESYDLVKNRIVKDSELDYSDKKTLKWRDSEEEMGYYSFSNKSVSVRDIEDGILYSYKGKDTVATMANVDVAVNVDYYRIADGSVWEGSLDKIVIENNVSLKVMFLKVGDEWLVYKVTPVTSPVLSISENYDYSDIFTGITKEPEVSKKIVIDKNKLLEQ